MAVKKIDRTVERIRKKYELDEEDIDVIRHMLESVVESRDRRIRHIEKILTTLRTRDRLSTSINRERVVSGLRATIAAHGPIDNNLIGSAVKRIVGA